MSELTPETLKASLYYDPVTGIFVWKGYFRRGLWITHKQGEQAGGVAVNGYRIIGLNGCMYKAHRLAFLYMEGHMPTVYVDHINRIRDDNRWCNLRHATKLQNAHNREDSSKVLGVWHDTCGDRYRARKTWVNGSADSIGSYKQFWDAIYARKSWEASVSEDRILDKVGMK